MNRDTDFLKSLISSYKANVLDIFPVEITQKSLEFETLRKFESLIEEKNDHCFDRDCFPGHITGSSVVLSPDLKKVVLTHHKKLNKWLQLGGHSDGDHISSRVALKEAEEESGLEKIELYSPVTMTKSSFHEALPLDFDIHQIPSRKNEPEHYHYDVRFLIVAESEKLTISDESNDLKWFDLNDVKEVTKEDSTLRQIEKVKWLIKKMVN